MWKYNYSVFDNNWLAHYGIKGQQWGVRRFQNEDGSLTKEGKERYRLSSQAVGYYKEAKKNVLEDIRNSESNIKQLKKSGPDKAEKWLDRAFGSDWRNKKYMKDVWEVDDPIEYGKKEAQKEYDYMLSSSLKNIKYYKDQSKKLDALISKWSNVDVNHLSKEDLRKLKEIDKYLKSYG